jgi:probable HAF family extracellular repeat protein
MLSLLTKCKVALVFALGLLFAPQWVRAQVSRQPAVRFTLIDLSQPGDDYSLACGINARGNVVGIAGKRLPEGTCVAHAFLWRRGIRTWLGASGQQQCYAYSIDDRDQVAGYEASGSTEHAVVWSNGKAKPLNSDQSQFSHSYAVNNEGEVAGVADIAGRYGHPCLWRKGKEIDLGALGGSGGCVYGLNDRGQAVGYAFRKLFGGDDMYCEAALWQHGAIEPLGMGEAAYAINNRGQAVGAPGFVWDNDHRKGVKLGTLGGKYTNAFAINDLGQVVGKSDAFGGKAHAFYWENGVMTDLNAVVRAPGWELTEARGINARGQIVGSGLRNGRTHAYLLTPIAANAVQPLTFADASRWSNAGGQYLFPAPAAQTGSAEESVTDRYGEHTSTTLSTPIFASGVEMRAIIQSTWIMPCLMKTEDGRPIYYDQFDYSRHFAPHDGQTAVYLAVRLTNRSDRTFRFRFMDTFLPLLRVPTGKELQTNASQPPHSFGTIQSPPLAPGQSFVLMRAAKLACTKDSVDLLCTMMDMGATVEGLRPGSYAVRLAFSSDDQGFPETEFWYGGAITPPVIIEIR